MLDFISCLLLELTDLFFRNAVLEVGIELKIRDCLTHWIFFLEEGIVLEETIFGMVMKYLDAIFSGIGLKWLFGLEGCIWLKFPF